MTHEAVAADARERTRRRGVTVARRPDEPAPDLTDYYVVHRAMSVDADRLATAAAELVERPQPARMAELRRYLDGISGEIESHHHVEDDFVWPMLEQVAGHRTALVELTDDHDRLDPILRRAGELAAAEQATPELAAVLRELAELLVRHIAREERDVFPIISEYVRAEDYDRVQRRFRGNLKPAQLAFVVPWVVRHATGTERAELVGSAGWPLRLMLRLFEGRFLDRERLLFGTGMLTRKDRRTVRIMRTVGRVHTAALRLTGGRIGSHWAGCSDVVLLTVIGRRSGQLRTVPLMCLLDGDDILVAASQGGVDAEPQWWLNLRANPHADVVLRGERFAVTAAEVGEDERPALWARFVDTYAGFAGYQAGVRRRIAVVRLSRGPAIGPAGQRQSEA